METQLSEQDKLAESAVAAKHYFERLERITDELVRELIAITGNESSPLRCSAIEERNEVRVSAPPFQPSRIRHWPLIAGGNVVSRFSVERPGREDIGEPEWVRVGIFQLDLEGVVWLPDDNGDLTEGAEIVDTFQTNWRGWRSLINRIYHWLATQAVTAA